MTRYIKAAQIKERNGSTNTYAPFAIPATDPDCLPPNPTAAGFRPGACDTLASSMPAEIAVHVSGHDLTNLSALWEYIGARMALVMPGAVALAGWPPFPFGQLGRGPRPPSLAELVGLGVCGEKLGLYLDAVLYLHDHSPPQMRRGGKLRPMLHVILATPHHVLQGTS